jgi:hypothetical protein
MSPTHRLLLTVLIAIAQVSCGSSIDSEEAAVIRIFVNSNLNNLFGKIESDDKPLKVIYVANMTTGFQSRHQERFSGLGSAVKRTTADSILRRNDREYEVNSQISFSIPHRVIPEAKIVGILKQGGWASVYREYPALQGVIWFSRVGFDMERTQALLYFIRASQRTGEEGWLVLMEKAKGSWREAGRKMIWTD